ncbi:Uncharacterised protein [Bacillus freudenreichii]|nr:Uncharacterised protein [Bacillus freudenreichii]
MVNKGKPIILPKETQKEMAEFFLRHSIPKILAEREKEK